MGSTPRLHPPPVTHRWPEVSPANSCYTSPPMHSSRYAASGDVYSPLGPRRNSEYEHSQHFPGFAYINGEATTGWAKQKHSREAARLVDAKTPEHFQSESTRKWKVPRQDSGVDVLTASLSFNCYNGCGVFLFFRGLKTFIQHLMFLLTAGDKKVCIQFQIIQIVAAKWFKECNAAAKLCLCGKECTPLLGFASSQHTDHPTRPRPGSTSVCCEMLLITV